jgi:hypothetical protein
MRYLLCLLFVITSAFAQPDYGPYVITEGSFLPACDGVKLLAPIEDDWQVFYALGDSAYHLRLNIETGEITQLSALPGSEEGWGRRLCDAVWTEDSSWSVLCYDTTLEYNRTNLISNREDSFQSIQIDSGRNYHTDYVGSAVHGFSILRARPSGGVYAAWAEYWCDWFCATCGAVVESLPVNATDDYPDYLYIPQVWESKFIILPVDSFSYLGIVGSYEPELFYQVDCYTSWEVSFDCEFYPSEFMSISNRQFVVLSEPSYYNSTQILELDTTGSCNVLNSFDSEVIASASHPDYGFAWIDQVGRGLRLWRAGLDGQPVATEGLIHHHDAYTIDKINLDIADDGTIAVIWCESEENSRTIRTCAVEWDTPLSVDNSPRVPLPLSLTLSAYPNPFNSTVKLSYELPVGGEVNLSIYNVAGQQVETLVDGHTAAGTYEASWSPEVASGVYFALLTTPAVTKSTKLLYLR